MHTGQAFFDEVFEKIRGEQVFDSKIFDTVQGGHALYGKADGKQTNDT